MINTIIIQSSIYGVIIYFLLYHESLHYCLGNSFGYRLRLFAANNMQGTTKMRIRFDYARKHDVTLADLRHGLASVGSHFLS